jgi:hypothetical protein
MEGFTKSNFPPRSWEGNYELLKGSPSSSSFSSGSPLFHQEMSFFIYSVPEIPPLGAISGTPCSQGVTPHL